MNPLIPDIGMSDPHVRAFGDTAYLYCGHDDTPDDETWVMKEWRVFASTDLVHWDLAGTISPGDTYLGEGSSDCWAADAAERNGRYYFYFSDRDRSIGVMTGGSPVGPFRDALGKPLVSPKHDPTIFIDDDPGRTPYIIYGEKSHSYHIARLGEDMISLAERPRPIVIHGEQWQNAGSWMDKNYLFKHDGVYYLSWGSDYATSHSVYGPYQCAGSVGEGYKLGPFAHGSFFWWKGQFYHAWCYYLRQGFKYRETIMTYCHFGDQGQVVTDTQFLDLHAGYGVGRYDAAWEKIQAAWFYEKSPGVRKQACPEGGFEVRSARSGDWLRFAHATLDAATDTFFARVSSAGQDAAIEVRLNNPAGPPLGTLAVPHTGPGNYETVSCAIDNVSGERDLFIVFTGTDTDVSLSWFSFTRPE